MMRLLLSLLCLSILSGCSIFRSETTSSATKNINTVTKKTTVTDTIAPDGRVIPLKQVVYEEVTSKEVAQAEQSKEYKSDLPAMASGLLGMGEIGDIVLGALGLGTTAVAAKKGVSIYNTIRDAPPRQPIDQTQPLRATKREDDEPPANP